MSTALATNDIRQFERAFVALRGGYKPEDFSVRDHVGERRIVVISDAHVPYHDEGLLARALARSIEFGVQAVVWLGDLMDMPTYSSWGNEDKRTKYVRELETTRGVVEYFADFVDRQYWSAGNHEQRYFRKTDFGTGMEQLALQAGLGSMLKDGTLMVSDNPTLTYGRDWLLTHPASYGPSPLVVPGKIADIQGKNVASAHAHHWAQGTSPSGKWTVIETGGAFNPKAVKYVQHRVTTHRAWVNGFVILLDGMPLLFR